MKNNAIKILISLRKKHFLRGILFLSATLLVLGVFGNSLAIGAVLPDTSSDFLVEFTPEIPGPNERVSVKITSYNFDINRSYISWFVDGKLKLKGSGEKSFSFMTGGKGGKTVLFVSLANEDGANLSKTIYFTPAEVDLLWEAETYTPFFYKGKPMPSPGSMVKVTAVPHFNKYAAKNSSNLVYDWKLDHKNKPQQSGAGMNSFTFKTEGPFNESIVSVEVSDYKRTVAAKNSVRIINRQPALIFYQDHPLKGIIYNNAFKKEFDFYEDEMAIRAEPYFFSRSALRTVKYDWRMNNKRIQPEEKKNTLNFRLEPGSSGSAWIMLKISNPYKLLQFTEKAFHINFGL